MGKEHGQKLIIVESPAKIKTIKKFLGSEYTVMASLGHIRDLPQRDLAVDETTFEPRYETIQGKQKVVNDLKKAASQADVVYLAPDPDREGEAIAWHIAEILRPVAKNIQRVTFNEITSSAVREALAHPRDIDQSLFEAQQARRVLDRLVGYKISPLLWKSVKRGLSAGRVQSVALRLIVDREDARLAFVPKEYWNISAMLSRRISETKAPEAMFRADLAKVNGKKAEIPNAASAFFVENAVRGQLFAVSSVEEKERRRSPLPPFTTSTLQQAANQRLGFGAKHTMSVAQRLYEGVDIPDLGTTALITYMRTDSVRIADEAKKAAAQFIESKYGREYLPKGAGGRSFKGKSGAQDAHEAIRPVNVALAPEDVRDALTGEQYRLYSLIWSRFVASQMADARFHDTAVTIVCANHDAAALAEAAAKAESDATAEASAPETTPKASKQANAKGIAEYLRKPVPAKTVQEHASVLDGTPVFLSEWKAKGERMLFAGWMKVMSTDEKNAALPALDNGEGLALESLKKEQKFTQPEPRFTEATLVKELEEKGIGRPSTYAAIISTILDRGYVVLEEKKFAPTELGRVVCSKLKESFSRLMDYGFTAEMESGLDRVAEHAQDWQALMREFAGYLYPAIEEAAGNMGAKSAVPAGVPCPECGKPLNIKFGKNGTFLACSGYPECTFTADFSRGEDGAVRIADKPKEESVGTCPQCGKKLLLRHGRNGEFLACEGYPQCKYTANITRGADGTVTPVEKEAPVSVGKCPECGRDLVVKKSPTGSRFIACTGYPDCRHAESFPTGVRCPKCGEGMLVEKSSKRGKIFYSCDRFPKCDYSLWDMPVPGQCPKCGSPFMVLKKTRGGTEKTACPQCKHEKDQ